MCRGLFFDLRKAKRRAQKLAEDSGHEHFLFCLTESVAVARLYPTRNPPTPHDWVAFYKARGHEFTKRAKLHATKPRRSADFGFKIIPPQKSSKLRMEKS